MADRIGSAHTRESLWASALTFLPELGLSKVVFLDLSQTRAPLILSNADQKWTDGYRENVTLGHDPFPLNCLSQITPVLTGIAHLETHPDLDDGGRDLVAQGSDSLDIRTGMSVTITPDQAGAGVGWNLMTDKSITEFEELRMHHEADWRAWCQITSAGLAMLAQNAAKTILTTREHDSLAYIADGLRTTDIGHRLGIAEVTVEMHLRNARTKLGAKTRDHAVAIALRAKII
jgi:DNA-binding CsgD family transcriptional regulator